ncbi:MAG TPA: cell envelope integrity protein CreD, partial [Candidatus Eisenbacteria bacterium]
NSQSITGPALVIPYTHRWTEVTAAGKEVSRTETRHAVFLPDRLTARGNLDGDVRRRGIFAVPVYTLGMALEGEFARPDVASLDINPEDVAWERAQLAVGVSDARAIQEASSVTWDGRAVPFLPGTGAFRDTETGIHAEVGLPAGSGPIAFSFPLTMNGSLGLYLAPFARTTRLEIRSDYPHPSFQGNWLPDERAVTANGFQATWSIPFLGRNYPQAWRAEIGMSKEIAASRFGVELVNPVDQYRMAARSVKYAGLFILLTFATVWLIELLSGVRVHPIQYLLLGAALCLFYLLELSLSEHLGFPTAYGVASLAVIVMVASYGLVMLRRAGRALTIGAGVTLLYGYLYILLVNEDYALLIGSVGLFLILAAIMFVTRRVAWYGSGDRMVAG